MTINDQASTSSTPRTDERYPNLKPMLMRYDATIERLRAEVERLRAALRFYADPENHHWQQKEHEDGERYTKASSFVDEDGGERARRALTPQEDR